MLGLLKSIKHRTFPVDESAPVTDARFVVVDTELTGLDEKKDSIVSLGAVRMHGGVIDIGNTFYRLVSPGTKLKAESVVIHGITPSDVAAQPEIDAALSEFLDFCGDSVLVGHFVSIDVSFINREMKRVFGETIRNRVVDTFSVYEWLRTRGAAHGCLASPGADYKLYDIVKCFGIPVNGGHNAIMDAFITAQLFQRFLPMLTQAGVRGIGDLLHTGSPFKGGDRFRLSGEIVNF